MLMKFGKKIIIFLTIYCLFSLNSTENIKIGMSGVFSGPNKNLGLDYRQGALLYFNKTNSEGGIKNRKIELIHYDDTYNPNPCIENTEKLINIDNIDLLFNYVGTPTTTSILPLLKIYEEKNIILFGNLSGAGAQRIQPYSKYVYNIRASYREEAKYLVEYLYSKGIRNISIIYQIDGYGRSGYVGVKEKLEEYGLKLSSEASYKRGWNYNQSMKVQARHIKNSSPEAIISIGTYEACAAFIRDSREMGLNIPIANISFVGTESLIGLLNQFNISKENLIFSEVVPYYRDKSIPLVKEYNNIIEQNNLTPNFISLEGYINAKLLVQILKESSLPIKRDNMKQIIKNMSPIDIGLDKRVQFKDDDNQILHKVYLYKLGSNNLLVPIK